MSSVNPASSAAEPEQNLYELLGITRAAVVAADGERALTVAYRRAALRAHPDKGGDAAAFRRVTFAYEVLRDPAKRRVYDTSGFTEQDAQEWNDTCVGSGAACVSVCYARYLFAWCARRFVACVAVIVCNVDCVHAKCART